MRNKNKLNIVIITLAIIFALSAISTTNKFDKFMNNDEMVITHDEFDLKTLKTSGYWDNFSFIFIDSNWSTAAKYEWCSGDGSLATPYLLENISIDATLSPTGSGIYINNSRNAYFIIRNCTVYKSGGGVFDAGIKLENTTKGTLINNNCSDNQNGILLYGKCDNNFVSGNNATHNFNGIYLDGYKAGNKCNNNTILGNNASFNTNGIYLVADNGEGKNNIFLANIVNNNSNIGIYLRSGTGIDNLCSNNTISENIANYNNGYGIDLSQGCDNNTISGNTVNNNTRHGIILDHCDKNIISGNNVNDNKESGIHLAVDINNSTISENNATDNQINGIYLGSGKNNTFSGNIANDNTQIGIDLNNCDKSTLSGNIANDNTQTGIDLNNCKNNTISGNIANDNNGGIKLESECDNNTIAGNTANGNNPAGIVITFYCNNNTIVGNTANGNSQIGIWLQGWSYNNLLLENNASYNLWGGIYLWGSCNNNTISRNTANNNTSWAGILLNDNCVNNTISGNIVNNNTDYGIYLLTKCDNNTISGNIANNNEVYGIYLVGDCDNNTITGNYIYLNIDMDLVISAECNDTIIKKNVLTSEHEANLLDDDGTNTIIDQNYYLPTVPSLYVCVIAQSFSKEEFIITLSISSGLSSEINPWIQSLQIWWNRTIVNSTSIIELGTGLYNITLTPKLVEPGQDPILLNMTINSANHQNKYFELELAVDPEAVGIYPPSSASGPSGDGNGGNGEGGEETIVTISGIDIFVMGFALVIGLAGIAIFLIRKRMRIENI